MELEKGRAIAEEENNKVATAFPQLWAMAREITPGSKALRNHGTKFRVCPDDMCRLYAKKQRLS